MLAISTHRLKRERKFLRRSYSWSRYIGAGFEMKAFRELENVITRPQALIHEAERNDLFRNGV
jgi:hypothetical protein